MNPANANSPIADAPFGRQNALHVLDRGRRVLSAMNALGSAPQHEQPNVADPTFSQLVKQWQYETGASETDATFFQTLLEVKDPGPEARSLIEGARRGLLRVGNDPRSIWLAELARRLYGPDGPRVEVET